jgi:hypothetical protein
VRSSRLRGGDHPLRHRDAATELSCEG